MFSVRRGCVHFVRISRTDFIRRATSLRNLRPLCGLAHGGHPPVLFRGKNSISNRIEFCKPCTLLQSSVARYSSQDLPAHHKVILPNLSPTMESGTIVSWEKEEGDRVNEGDVLAMIETDKATMEMETPEEGYIAKILLPAGSKDVAVKEIICIIVEEEGDIAAFKDYVHVAEVPGVPAQEAQEPVAADKPTETAPPPPPTPSSVSTEGAPSAAKHRVLASPLAKKMAAEKGIDLSTITGTGPKGRVTAEDVELAAQKAVPAPTPAVAAAPTFTPPSPTIVARPAAEGTFVDINLSGMRKTIARRLLESKQTIPHYYLSVDVNMDAVLQLRKSLNDLGGSEYKLSINDFIIKASALALKKVPECNSSWMGDFIRQFNTVDISVAVSTEGGLITPIVFNADRKGLVSISSDVRTLAEKARNKTIKPEEFQGGTFTISNLGMFGITSFSAVINPPQSCILAIGSTDKRIVPDEESEKGFKVANVMSVTMSCDHRVVDGAVGAEWLRQFRKLLENPSTMLL